ncbi:MAG: hypothetical protein ABI972_27410 [Acidobacteriota bacterium]
MRRVVRFLAGGLALWQLAGLAVLCWSLLRAPSHPTLPSGAMDDESTRLAATINVPPAKRLAALHDLARVQYDASRPLLAWRLFRLMESEIGPEDSTGMWGSTVYNQGLALDRSGFPAYARDQFERLITSRVNDADAGPNLMTPTANYRHYAARMMAQTFEQEGNHIQALIWHHKAIKLYPYSSWCGTCSSGAQTAALVELARDAAKLGPLVMLGALIAS